MTKELEALEEIGNHKIKYDVNIKYDNGDETQRSFETIKDMFPNQFALIETTLKDFEKLNKDYSRVVNEKIELCIKCVKEYRALEIIKNKNVDILRIKITQNVEQYNTRKIKGCRNLTKEEYELLKEILL